jgi:hypothetical protein
VSPIEMILAALAVGVSKAAQEVGSSFFKDAYEQLKQLLKAKFADNEKAKTALDDYEQDSDTYKKPLKKEMESAGIATDEEILKRAQAIMEKADPEGEKVGKYKVNLYGTSQGTVVGDGNNIRNDFRNISNPKDKGETTKK